MKTKEEEYFPVIMTCRNDMKMEFEASEKIQLEIDQFTDEQMNKIAKNMSKLLIDGYEEALRECVMMELER